MKIEFDQLLNWTKFQFCYKITKTKFFWNPKNQYQDQTRSIKTLKISIIGIEGSFYNQEPNMIGCYHWVQVTVQLIQFQNT